MKSKDGQSQYDRNQNSSCCWEEELEAKNGHKRTFYNDENALYLPCLMLYPLVACGVEQLDYG